jgi:hypothetical protein
MQVSDCMAMSAERDQVFFRIVAGAAAKLFVMDFQVRHRTAGLTAPVITTQDLLPATPVRHGIQPKAWEF